MKPPLSPVLALAFAEDAMALASVAEAQGWPENAAALREFAAKVRPDTARWSRKERSA